MNGPKLLNLAGSVPFLDLKRNDLNVSSIMQHSEGYADEVPQTPS